MLGGYVERARYIGQRLEEEEEPEEMADLLPHWDIYSIQSRPTFQDFILIAEFSELEGPRPWITIPKETDGRFDLNEFSIRIMSVDYHHNVNSESFHGMEDTHLLMTESQRGFHAYVHHFTLYDAYARGYVRPFCVSYVSTDNRKLTNFYDEISKEFVKVSSLLKYGSLMTFDRDLKCKLADLMHTKVQYLLRQERQSREEEEDEDEDEYTSSRISAVEMEVLENTSTQAIDSAIMETSSLQERIASLKNDPDKEALFKRLHESPSVSPEDDDFDLKDLSMTGSYKEPGPLHQKSMRRSGSFSNIYHRCYPSGGKPSNYEPKITKPSPGRRFEKTLRSLHELCHWGAKEGLNMLRDFHQVYNKDYVTLEIQRQDRLLSAPETGMVTLGKTLLGNLHLNQLVIQNTPSQNSVMSPFSPSIPKWKSTDSFASAESFLSCDDDELVLPSDPASGSVNVTLCDSLSSPDEIQSATVVDTTDAMTPETDTAASSPDEPSDSDARSSTNSQSTGQSLYTGTSLFGSSTASHRVSIELEELSVAATDMLAPGVYSVASVATQTTVPEFGQLRLMQTCMFSGHLLHSLLSGRPVVVLGSAASEAICRAWVACLMQFIPGNSSQSGCVQVWHTASLSLSQISRWRLIGLQRPEKKAPNHLIPNSVKNYVTVFDVEKRTLTCPPYKGNILNRCAKPKKFRSEGSFISYMHSCLSQFTSLAYVYYHSVCLQRTDDSSASFDEFEHRKVEFCKKFELHEHDMQIVENMVESVLETKLQALSISQDRESPSRPLRIDNRKSQTFKA